MPPEVPSLLGLYVAAAKLSLDPALESGGRVALSGQESKPVHVFLCGVEFGRKSRTLPAFLALLRPNYRDLGRIRPPLEKRYRDPVPRRFPILVA